MRKLRITPRWAEIILIIIIGLVTVVGFLLVTIAEQIQAGQRPEPFFGPALIPPLAVVMGLLLLNILLVSRRVAVEQVLLPVSGLLLGIGLVMIWRLRGADGVWQQLTRGFIPGLLVIGTLITWPNLIERIRRWTIPISLIGLALPVLTAFFGVQDETGARLALKLGPLPPIQTSELLKVALIIFLAWYIDREGPEVEGRARPVLGWLRLPSPRYFLPGLLFVGMATLALVQMSDFGAVLILGFIFIGMLYAGFETRIFATVAAIGVGMALLVGLALSFTWEVPTVIQYRFLAFQDPWSQEEILYGGEPTGISVSEGPGYQIQQAVYAMIAGGVTGTGLGYGSPEFVPLAQSDFIFAAIVEEMGAIIAMALLALYVILLLRILRVAVLLPVEQVFERLLLVGIGIHLFTQVFIMVGGTLNVMPLTGVTIPFLSLGGVALLVNMTEIGLTLAVAQRLEALRL